MFIEELITRSLILVFGYAYPAYQCFKTLEKNKVGIPELRFWCQYWVIIAIWAVFERFLDIFISWIPFYRAIKLVMHIYLWHPGTKGGSYMYDTLVQPYVSKHEATIDRGIEELKVRAWNLALDYWYNCAHMSSKKVMELLQMLMVQCMNAALSRPQSQDGEGKKPDEAPTPPSTPAKKDGGEKRPAAAKDSVNSKTASFKAKSQNKASEETSALKSVKQDNKSDNDQEILAARVRLRRVNSKE